MNEKMTPEEFCAALDAEGLEYGFLDYGLTHTNLDESEDPEFYALVKSMAEKYEVVAPLRDDLFDYMDKYL